MCVSEFWCSLKSPFLFVKCWVLSIQSFHIFVLNRRLWYCCHWQTNPTYRQGHSQSYSTGIPVPTVLYIQKCPQCIPFYTYSSFNPKHFIINSHGIGFSMCQTDNVYCTVYVKYNLLYKTHERPYIQQRSRCHWWWNQSRSWWAWDQKWRMGLGWFHHTGWQEDFDSLKSVCRSLLHQINMLNELKQKPQISHILKVCLPCHLIFRWMQIIPFVYLEKRLINIY